MSKKKIEASIVINCDFSRLISCTLKPKNFLNSDIIVVTYLYIIFALITSEN